MRGALHLFTLPVDVAGVLGGNFDLLDHHIMQIAERFT